MPTDPSKVLTCPLCDRPALKGSNPIFKGLGERFKCSHNSELASGPSDGDCVFVFGQWSLEAWNSLPRFTSQDVEDAKPKWLPIESAPKDGTIILCRGGWLRKFPQALHWRKFFDGSEGWSRENGDIMNPAQWMPLPSPPDAMKNGEA